MCLNIRYQVKSKFETLKNELNSLRGSETNRIDDYDKSKQKELIDLEHLGQEYCHEHSKIMHQMEHINWHLQHVHPHDVVTTSIEPPHHLLQHQHSDTSTVALNHSHGKTLFNAKPSSNLVQNENYILLLNNLYFISLFHHFWSFLLINFCYLINLVTIVKQGKFFSPSKIQQEFVFYK